jgi:hypothetical protein
MVSFPGEDRIMQAAHERWEGPEIPDFGEHRCGCPCHDMSEDEYDEGGESKCTCEDLANDEEEDLRAEYELAKWEDSLSRE